MKKHDLVILFSGGADSTLLLALSKSIGKTPLAVMIGYGQLHIEELDIAKKILDNNKIENIRIDISGYDVNSGLTGNGKKGIYEGVSEYNVPARNTIFLSIAAGIAEARGIDTVWIGADMSDFYGKFTDCYQSYIGSVNELFKISFSKPITVEAPLLGFTKEMVLKSLEKIYEINIKDIYSGYGKFA